MSNGTGTFPVLQKAAAFTGGDAAVVLTSQSRLRWASRRPGDVPSTLLKAVC